VWVSTMSQLVVHATCACLAADCSECQRVANCPCILQQDDVLPIMSARPIRVARDVEGNTFQKGFPVVKHGPSADALREVSGSSSDTASAQE
jgi:hypothetical protein